MDDETINRNQEGEEDRKLLSPVESLGLGDSYFVDENYQEAANAYAASIISSLDAKYDGEEKGQQQQEDEQVDSSPIICVRALSHRSEAFYRLGRYEEALEDARNAIRRTSEEQQQPTLIRGLRSGETEMFHKRAGNAAFELKRYEEAKEHYKHASQLASLNQRPTVSEYDHRVVECIEKLGSHSGVKLEIKKTVSPSSHLPPTHPKIAAAAEEVKITPAISAKTTTPTTHASLTMPKYQYYQSDNVMTISILETNVKAENLDVKFEKKRLVVKLTKSQQGGPGAKTKAFTVIAGTLYSEVIVDRCKIVIKAEKILIKLRKKDKFEWHELLNKKDDAPTELKTPKTDKNSSRDAAPKEGKTEAVEVKESASSTKTDTTTTIPRPYASTKDWNKIEADIKKEEEEETGVGDEALNKLFKQIYGNADDDTRRAMVKSYQTSGGTVLSTNWKEVAEKNYEEERTAPKGMEWKNWEGEKLPMEDDD